MDDVLVSNTYHTLILARYASVKYWAIKFYFKKQLFDTFQIHRVYTRDTWWKTDTHKIHDFLLFLAVCNWLSNNVYFLVYILYVIAWLSLPILLIFIFIFMLLSTFSFVSFCCFENAAIVDCYVKSISLLFVIVVTCMFDLSFAYVFFLLLSFSS